ncbi:MAG TPA: HEAT repeat domain-containing protein [Chthonomonadaceae bacterium]|nr:HEAT repeat domain-containing protein [Chthonomonadaceae bacterium]
MKLRCTVLPVCVGLLLAVLAPAACCAQQDLDSRIAALKAYRYGQSAAPLDALRAEVSEARGSDTARRQVARALAGVLASDAAFEAKQFACRQLVFVGSDAEVPALAALLTDRQLAHYALMALARIGTPAVADALVTALPASSSAAEIEILDTLARMRDKRVVAAAKARLAASDPALRDEAAMALGHIADEESIKALESRYVETMGAARESVAQALLAAAAEVLHPRGAAEASAIYDFLDRHMPDPITATAVLRGRVATMGDLAAPLVVKALSENDSRRQDAAAMILREFPPNSPRVARAIASAVGTLHGRGLVLAIEVMGDRGEVGAAPVVSAEMLNADPLIRVAAIRAAGSIGDASIVPALLAVAASGSPDERAAARESLVRVRGAAVDRALLATLGASAPAIQVQAIQALGRRAALGIGPRLVQVARTGDPAVSAAALRVLRDEGSPALLPSLVDVLLTLPKERRDAAIEAIADVARRHPESRNGLPLLFDRLVQVSKTDDRVALIMTVGMIGGHEALDPLRRAVADNTPAVQAAALSALAEWPTDEPMADLLRIVRTTSDPNRRAVALRGYLRMVGNSDQRTPAEAFRLFMEAKGVASGPEAQRLILAGLAKEASPEALDYAKGLTANAAVRGEAELAVVEIARGTLGGWPDQTRAALEPIARSGSNEQARARAEALLVVAKRFDDFIVAWDVSPAYQQDGADYTRLFDIPFPPEQKAPVAWRPMPVGTMPDQPWLLDLLAQWGGEQRVAYLRTAVRCAAERDLRLELGSDDGIKVWWNGEVVHAHNVARAVAPGQERVTVHAKAGWNLLMLKITQNNQGWGACARLTNPDGTPATGLQLAVPSSIKDL